MEIIVRAWEERDIPDMVRIWNEVVEEGIAFPQEELLTIQSGTEFFASQTYNGVAVDQETGRVLGLYILHPNNVGRCGHICNASYAVSGGSRGLHIGEKQVPSGFLSRFTVCVLLRWSRRPSILRSGNHKNELHGEYQATPRSQNPQAPDCRPW